VIELAGTVHELGILQRPARIEQILQTLRPVAPVESRPILDALDTEYRRIGPRPAELGAVESSLEELEATIRGNIWDAVLRDIRLLSGRRVNQHQADLFRQADDLTTKIVEAGGYRVATELQIRELQRLHREMVAAYSDLSDLIAKSLQEEAAVRGIRRPDSTVRQA
jgi:hypothetical protein